MYQCRYSNNSRCFTRQSRETSRTPHKRVGVAYDDISRLHNIGMTRARNSYHVTNSHRTNETTSGRRRIDCIAGFLSLDLWHNVAVRRNRLREYFVMFSSPFRSRPDAGLHFERFVVALLQVSCRSVKDRTLRTLWLADVARNTEGCKRIANNL